MKKFSNQLARKYARLLRKGDYHSMMLEEIADMLETYADERVANIALSTKIRRQNEEVKK